MMNQELEIPALRRTALTLHALENEDQSWMLSHLPVEHRKALSNLLAELRELGIPRDQSLVRAALSEAPPEKGPSRTTGLARVLSQEPPELQPQLLALLDEDARHLVQQLVGERLVMSPSAPANWTPDFRAAVVNAWRNLATPT